MTLKEVDGEIGNLTRAIGDLQKSREAGRTHRQEMEGERDELAFVSFTSKSAKAKADLGAVKRATAALEEEERDREAGLRHAEAKLEGLREAREVAYREQKRGELIEEGKVCVEEAEALSSGDYSLVDGHEKRRARMSYLAIEAGLARGPVFTMTHFWESDQARKWKAMPGRVRRPTSNVYLERTYSQICRAQLDGVLNRAGGSHDEAPTAGEQGESVGVGGEAQP